MVGCFFFFSNSCDPIHSILAGIHISVLKTESSNKAEDQPRSALDLLREDLGDAFWIQHSTSLWMAVWKRLGGKVSF